MYNFRTDMADERRDIYKKQNNMSSEIPGIEVEESIDGENIKVSKVKIVDENGEKAIGKPKGTYITIDVKNLKIAEEEEIEKAALNMFKHLKQLLDEHIEKEDSILVVGLGNNAVTPDSLRT
jgi:spore protease